MKRIQDFAHCFPGVLLLMVTLIVASGCDVVSRDQEGQGLAGTYGPVSSDSLAYAAIFNPRHPNPVTGRTKVSIRLSQRSGASFHMELKNTADTQPDDNRRNDGQVSGRIIIPDSLTVWPDSLDISPDSMQILYSDTLVSKGLDYSFSGNYIFAIDRLYLYLDKDTTRPARHNLIPREWQVEEGTLSGSTSRTVDRSGRLIVKDDPVNDETRPSGTVKLSFKLQK